MHRSPHWCAIAAALAIASCASSPARYDDRLSSWDEIADARETAREDLSSTFADDARLAELLSYARANNPGIEAAFQHWKEALEQVPQATTLPSPRLTFAWYLSELETRTGPMQARLGLAQPFPWFGELAAAGDVAFEASEAARELLEAKRLEVEQRVRDAWYELAWLEQAIAITEANRELLVHWESVARARFRTGSGPHADVIRAQVELGKHEDRVQSLIDLRRPFSAKLNAALDRPTDAALPVPSFPLPEPPAVDESALAMALRTSSPTLEALGHRVEAAKHGIELADKAFWPDFVVGAEYGFVGDARTPGVSGSGDDPFALTLGLDLPIWRGAYAAGAREAEARMKVARLEQDDALNRLASDLEMALYQLRDGGRRLVLFRDTLVPKGEESVRALDSAYQSGDEGFLDLIDAQRVLLEFRLEAVRAEADRAKALAEIERITGVSLHAELGS